MQVSAGFLESHLAELITLSLIGIVSWFLRGGVKMIITNTEKLFLKIEKSTKDQGRKIDELAKKQDERIGVLFSKFSDLNMISVEMQLKKETADVIIRRNVDDIDKLVNKFAEYDIRLTKHGHDISNGKINLEGFIKIIQEIERKQEINKELTQENKSAIDILKEKLPH